MGTTETLLYHTGDEDWHTHHVEFEAHMQHHHNLRGIVVRADQIGRTFLTSDIKESDQAPETMVPRHHHRGISVLKLVFPKWGRKSWGNLYSP